MNKILRIIKEEIENFFNDEPSMADAVYARKYGIEGEPKPEQQLSGEYIGSAPRTVRVPNRPQEFVPVYKNPKNLTGFGSSTRAVLIANGDLYVGTLFRLTHEDLLPYLAEKGIIPQASVDDYWKNFPKEFVAVQRLGGDNGFAQSTNYQGFPLYYTQMFEEANKKQPFYFKHETGIDELLDMNRGISYIPQGYKHNILDEEL